MTAVGTVIGCGIFADKNGCACVSGDDRSIYVEAPARKIVGRMKNGESVEDSLKGEVYEFIESRLHLDVGAVAIDKHGAPAIFFEAASFPWACCYDGSLYFGCSKDERFSEKIEIV